MRDADAFEAAVRGDLFRRGAALARRPAVVQRLLRPRGEVGVAGRRPAQVEFEIDDQPSGLGWMPDGSMLVVSMTKRQVLRRAPDGEISVHADLSRHRHLPLQRHGGGRRRAAPMSAISASTSTPRSRRAACRTCSPTTRPPSSPMSRRTARRASPPRTCTFPTAPVITPDGKTLIVGETLAACLTAFDIAPDGDLSNRRVWASTAPRVPDGICLDAAGAIWVANPTAPRMRADRRGRRGAGGDRRPASPATPACWAATTARRCSCSPRRPPCPDT